MEIFIKILQFFLCFTILVGIHEFGHFIMARIFKIRVEKFYIFFDPWFSLFKFKRKETEYGIGWLPMGGYVKIAGMIDESLDLEQMKKEPQPWEFRSKPAWQRFLVMVAGIIMNVLLAMAIYTGICYTWGTSYLSNDDIEWGYNFNEAGHEMGFVDGDKFLSINGVKVDDVDRIITDLIITNADRRVEVLRNGQVEELVIPLEVLIKTREEKRFEQLFTPRMPFIIDSVAKAPALGVLQKGDRITGVNDAQNLDILSCKEQIAQHKGDSVTLTLVRNGETRTLTARIDESGMLGVVLAVPRLNLHTREYTLLEAIPAGIRKSGEVISSYWQQLKMIVKPETKLYKEVGGFIAIGNVFPNEWDSYKFWSLTAFLSIIVAIMNLLPIPGLDGGHALFTFCEMITGRKMSDKFLEYAQYVGFILILALLLFANGNDIYKLFFK